MVDVGAKPITRREARAEARVRMRTETLEVIQNNAAKKGDVLAVARLAGIMGAKRTSDLIPLCHQIPLSQVEVEFTLEDDPPAVLISTKAVTEARTGVEMEALTAASVAALTIYDMCKAVDRGMTIEGLQLAFKSGGASGEYRRSPLDSRPR